MAVAYDALGAGSVVTATASTSWSHTGSGSNLAVIVVVIWNGTSFSGCSATYGGVAMTQLGIIPFNNSAGSTNTIMFGLLNAPGGTQTATFTSTALGQTKIKANSMSFTGVGSFGAAVTAFGANAASGVTMAVTARTNDMIAQVFGDTLTTTDWSAYNQTQKWNNGGVATSIGAVAGIATGSGSATTFTATGQTSQAWSGIGVPLVAMNLVQFDAVGGGITNASNGGTTQSWSHTVSNAPGTVVIVGFAIESLFVAWASYAPTAVTFGGQTMLPVYGQLGGNNSDSSSHVALYVLLNPSARGNQTVSVTIPAVTSFSWMNSVSYTGVGSIGTVVLNAGSSTTPSTGAVTSAVDHMVVSIMGAFLQTASSPTQTPRFSQSGTSNINSGYIQDALGATTVTTSMTAGASTTWSAVAVDLIPNTSTSFIPPSLLTYPTPGSYTYTIPVWATTIDVIGIGGGGGGGGGTGVQNGIGGGAASWVSTTIRRGQDIPWSVTSISVVVGAAGSAGAGGGPRTNGGNGGSSTASYTNMASGTTVITGAGGFGASRGDGTVAGDSPGNTTYNSVTYTGGVGGSFPFNLPTGIGAGGVGGAVGNGNGSAGTAGQMWINAYAATSMVDFFKLYQ